MKKYILIVGDGMSDYPLKELNGKTPLQAARKPNMDLLAKKGELLTFKSMEESFEMKGTDVAHLAIFGYDVERQYPGRGAMEAAAMGIKLEEGDIAYRCNLVTVEGSKLVDYSAGHVKTEEARELINEAGSKFGREGIEFYPGVQYRHILVLRKNFSHEVITFPPHENIGKSVEELGIKPKNQEKKAVDTAELLNRFTKESHELLSSNEINRKRRERGENEANGLWFWGQGPGANLKSFEERFKKKGAVITAVDVLRGLARLLKLDIIEVEGATGYFDTNYEGKARAAFEALKDYDFVLVHIEAPDEAGHTGNIKEKIRAIENIDGLVLGNLLKWLEKTDWEYVIGITADHATPISTQNHACDRVPVLFYKRGEDNKNEWDYDEESAGKGKVLKRFMDYFIAK